MDYEFKPQLNDKDQIDIIYNDKVYGTWNNEANVDYPEDLTIGRELNDLIDIGIAIGKQMQLDATLSLYPPKEVVEFNIGDRIRVLSGIKPIETVVEKIDWDERNNGWRYYFKDTNDPTDKTLYYEYGEKFGSPIVKI